MVTTVPSPAECRAQSEGHDEVHGGDEASFRSQSWWWLEDLDREGFAAGL